MKSLSILIADDEESIRALMQHWLSAAGHKVKGAGNATEAMAALKADQFDLVITDILMPDGDGLDLITGMKKAQPGAKIVAMSGGGRYMEGQDCLKMARGMGAHAIVTKPFTLPQLQAGIEQAFAPVPEQRW
jgi:DNA-binding NtrC family response regulator